LERKSTVEEIFICLVVFFSFILFLSWVRFEEIAENVLGRWSKPHVATLMQTALIDLKNLLQNGIILLNVQPTDLSGVSRKFDKILRLFFKGNLILFRIHC
jgi:hypothetical protein